MDQYLYLGYWITIDVRQPLQFVLDVLLALILRVLEWFGSEYFRETQESMLPNGTSPVADC